VPTDAMILTEEIFGPVAPIVPFETEQQAIDLANATEFGLVAYVYTGDLARGLRVSERLGGRHGRAEPGLVSDPAAPFAASNRAASAAKGGHAGRFWTTPNPTTSR